MSMQAEYNASMGHVTQQSMLTSNAQGQDVSGEMNIVFAVVGEGEDSLAVAAT